jgi:hypothetical protein
VRHGSASSAGNHCRACSSRAARGPFSSILSSAPPCVPWPVPHRIASREPHQPARHIC